MQDIHGASGKPMGRRDFLRRGGMGLSAAALASRSALAVEPAAKKVRIGVVGGGFGRAFQWHEHPNCEVVAVSDLRPERREALRNTYKCDRMIESLEKLVLEPDIDAVAIFTDGNLHVKHVVDAMTHGKHAISAVPAVWGSVEEAELLLDTVKSTGLTYMMAETGYYQQSTITARKFQDEGKFGTIYYCEAEYQHAGLEQLFFEGDKRTWRYGMAPMHYPTHSSSQLIGVTGERLTHVVCHGWGDDSPILKDNPYGNPFWNESAMFTTNLGHAFRLNVWWKGAHRGTERAQWIGDQMSFYMGHPNGIGPVIVRSGARMEKDDAGFEREAPEFENYTVPDWWKTDMLPEPLRHQTGHQGSHGFLTNEFVQALVEQRRPTVDVYEALAYTVPGVIAHESALRGGERLKIPQFERPA